MAYASYAALLFSLTALVMAQSSPSQEVTSAATPSPQAPRLAAWTPMSPVTFPPLSLSPAPTNFPSKFWTPQPAAASEVTQEEAPPLPHRPEAEVSDPSLPGSLFLLPSDHFLTNVPTPVSLYPADVPNYPWADVFFNQRASDKKKTKQKKQKKDKRPDKESEAETIPEAETIIESDDQATSSPQIFPTLTPSALNLTPVPPTQLQPAFAQFIQSLFGLNHARFPASADKK